MNITLNQPDNDFIKLKAVYEDTENLSNLIIKKDSCPTLISDEKTIYVYFAKNELDLNKIQSFFTSFAQKNLYDVDVDVCSFKVPKLESRLLGFIAESILTGQHKRFNLKTTKQDNKCDGLCVQNVKYNLHVVCESKGDDDESIFEHALIKAEFVNFARDLQDFPPNIGTAVHIADTIAKKAKTIDNVEVTILTETEMRALKMNLALSVNSGSKNEPRLVVLKYCSDSSLPLTAFVGKGITFDTGGYNLKPSMYMKDMKFDMSGGAVATSSLLAIAKAKAKANVVAVTVLVENAIGTVPESVITTMNGKTVQIDNTDAEGRLTLADAVTYSIREQKADRIISIATLTGAVLIALGVEKTGSFTNHPEFYKEFCTAVCRSGEKVWRLPLDAEVRKELTQSPIADLSNIGVTRWAGASQGASFVEAFAEDKPFIHLDIAGSAQLKARGRAPMIKALYTLVCQS